MWFGWQARLGQEGAAGWVCRRGMAWLAQRGTVGSVGRRGKAWEARCGCVGWQAIVPLGLSGRDS